MRWFKFYGGEYLSDPKMLMLKATERSCWITLLSFASVADDHGRVKYLSEAQLMTASNISPMHEEWDYTVGVLSKFESLGMIQQENAVITILNWDKWQDKNLTNAERQARYRERNAKVTQPSNKSNARIEENRTENTSSAEPLRIVKGSDEEKPKREPSAKYPHSKEVFGLWGKFPANWKVNRSQLQAAENLYAERGLSEVADALMFYKQHRDEQYCPDISTPYDLDSKWAKLEAFNEKL